MPGIYSGDWSVLLLHMTFVEFPLFELQRLMGHLHFEAPVHLENCAVLRHLAAFRTAAHAFQLLVHGTMSHFILTLKWPHTMKLICRNFSTVPGAKSSPKCQCCSICWQNAPLIFPDQKATLNCMNYIQLHRKSLPNNNLKKFPVVPNFPIVFLTDLLDGACWTNVWFIDCWWRSPPCPTCRIWRKKIRSKVWKPSVGTNGVRWCHPRNGAFGTGKFLET